MHRYHSAKTMKYSTQLPNHETWHTCAQCGTAYDQHLHGTSCPECGFTIAKIIETNLYPIAIFILFILIGSSCGITKQYGYRNHRNTVAQKVIQYEASKPYKWGDWKACQHFSERPKSHWPLRD